MTIKFYLWVLRCCQISIGMPHYLTIRTFVLNLQAVQVVAKGHMQIQQGSKARTTSHYTSSIGNRKWYHNEAGYLYTSVLCSLLSERNFSHHHKFWPGATPSCGRQCCSLQAEHLIAQSTPQCLKQTSYDKELRFTGQTGDNACPRSSKSQAYCLAVTIALWGASYWNCSQPARGCAC